MDVSNWIGVTILGSLFVGLFGVTAWAQGSVLEAALMWVLAFGLAATVCAGVYLAFGGL